MVDSVALTEIKVDVTTLKTTVLTHVTDVETRTVRLVQTKVFFGGNLGAGFAPLDSPAFIGTPTAPTAPLHDDTNLIANTEFTQNELEVLIMNGGFF